MENTSLLRNSFQPLKLFIKFINQWIGLLLIILSLLLNLGFTISSNSLSALSSFSMRSSLISLFVNNSLNFIVLNSQIPPFSPSCLSLMFVFLSLPFPSFPFLPLFSLSLPPFLPPPPFPLPSVPSSSISLPSFPSFPPPFLPLPITLLGPIFLFHPSLPLVLHTLLLLHLWKKETKL